MIARVFSTMVSLAALTGLTQPAIAGWNRADTQHFIIYSDGSTNQLEEFASDLERFDSLMKQLLGVRPESDPVQLPIYLVQNANRVSLLMGDDDRMIAGVYIPTSDGSFILGNREWDGKDDELPGRVVLFHEYAHHLMFRHLTNAYPAWYREGFAEFLSTSKIERDGTFSIGAPANHRAYAIREGVYMPIERLLFTPQSEMTDNERGMFYAQSWVLTHYLQSSVELNRQMLSYFSMLAKEKDPREAAVEAFGDLDALDKAVRKYGRRRIDYRRSNTPLEIRGDIEITSLTDLETDLAENELYLRIGFKPDQVLKDLNQIIEENPKNAKAYALLAQAESDRAHSEEDYDFDAALKAVDRAIQLDPDLIEARVRKAYLLMEPADHEEMSDQQVDWAAVRDQISAANAIDADDPRPLLAYVTSLEKEGGPMPPVALDAMMQVHGTMPEVTPIRTRLARMLAAEGRFDAALSLVGFLVADPHAGDSGRKLVEEIRTMQAAVDNETRNAAASSSVSESASGVNEET
ncbi:MAG: hypothetical protein GW854_04020 [Erythrobacter sp.]|nr:hypothetical protein [Erythrobacter sp.]